MSSYLELVRRAKDTNLSISDYIISTLFEDFEAQIKRKELIESLNKSIQNYRVDVIKVNAQLRERVSK